MNPPSHRMIDNRKFMWDGGVHAQEADAARVAETYRQAGFEVHVTGEGGEWFVYTRRQATANAGQG